MIELREREPAWWHPLMDFVFPPLCLGCGEFTEAAEAICGACCAEIDHDATPICLNCLQPLQEKNLCGVCGEWALPLFFCGGYVAPLDSIIKQFKFHGITPPADFFARQLADSFGEQIADLNANQLIPIALHPAREDVRGYNQAFLLAEALGKHLGLPVDNTSLRRVHKRRPQSNLSLRKRVANIKGVFRALPPPTPGTRSILVDDVATSGVTVMQAKEVLEEAGHRVVAVMAIAHGS
jgi:ComF family protein